MMEGRLVFVLFVCLVLTEYDLGIKGKIFTLSMVNQRQGV